MAHREFKDSKQVSWDVWDVYPALGDRRTSGVDRREYRRETEDRRAAFNAARLSPELAQGWLAFQSPGERRRLVPIPRGWEALDPMALERLCQAATPVGRARRLIE